MKFSKYPKSIYLLWFLSFLTGLDFIGAILIPFFKGWGGLSQFQIQLLQSWFTLWIFVLEVPTGIIGDKKGRKFSILCGFFLLVIGPIVYGSVPSFWVFLLGEFLFALGMAFISGADEALIFDISKEHKLEKNFGKIQGINDNLRLFGMLVSSLFVGILVNSLEVNRIFQLSALSMGATFILTLLFIKEPKIHSEKEFVPDYKQIFKKAYYNLRKNKVLRRLTVFLMLISTFSYFVIWFYQVVLQNVNVGEEYFGLFRIVLLVSEIVFAFVIIELLKKKKNKSLIIKISLFAVCIGFLGPILFDDVLGAVLLIVFAGGIGLKFRNIFSPYLNKHIESKERATTLSFISMAKRLGLTVFNPVFGLLADWSMNISLLILGILILIVGIFYAPKNSELKS